MGKMFVPCQMWWFLFLIFALSIPTTYGLFLKKFSGRNYVSVMFSWRLLDWNFPDVVSRNLAIMNGQFIPANALPVAIEIWRNKLFIVVPRWKAGVPAVLNWIPLDTNVGSSPKLIPYPSWEHNIAGACETGLTTAYRMHVDSCDRLWIVDSGTVLQGSETVQVCPFSIKVFDLRTDRLIRYYEIPKDQVIEEIFVGTVVVDLGPRGCDDAFAYMANEMGYALIVYDWRTHTSWRVSHSFFHPDPLVTDFNSTGGINYQIPTGGIFGLALSPLHTDGYRTLFFHPFSSYTEFAVSTRVLRDRNLAMNSFYDYQVLGKRSRGHSASEVMDEKTKILFFTLVDQDAIGCWNSRLPYNSKNHALIAQHSEMLIFPTDIRVHDDFVWFLSNRMPFFTERNLNQEDTNFRIMKISVSDAVSGTVCDIPKFIKME